MSPNDQHSNLNARKWNVRAETYDKKRFDFMRFMQKRTIELIDLRHGMHVLDIGCGTGWAVRYIAKLLHDKGEFYGIDISPRMIERAIEQTPLDGNIHFQIGSSEELPFPAGKIDVVLCTNSFHHYKNPMKVLS